MNPRYWVIAPYSYDAANPTEWESVWHYDLQHGIISIGWGELGDITGVEEKQILTRISRTYTDDPDSNAGARAVCRMLSTFSQVVRTGDIVIARHGRKVIAGVGTVRRTAYYDPNRNPVAKNQAGTAYSNHLDVDWARSPRDLAFDDIVFGMQTIYELPEDRFRELVPVVGVPAPVSPFVLQSGATPSQSTAPPAPPPNSASESLAATIEQKPSGRLQTLKLVLEIASIAVTVIGGIVALVWRSRQ